MIANLLQVISILIGDLLGVDRMKVKQVCWRQVILSFHGNNLKRWIEHANYLSSYSLYASVQNMFQE
jgi:hypothetical protein